MRGELERTMRLATRYFIAFAALATSACVTIGIVDAVGHYRENVAHVGEMQRAEAHIVATRIAGYLETLTMALRDVDALPWSPGCSMKMTGGMNCTDCSS